MTCARLRRPGWCRCWWARWHCCWRVWRGWALEDEQHVDHQVPHGGEPVEVVVGGPEKARAAALGRRETKIYEEMINAGRVSFLSVPVLQGMLEGGVPVIADGQVVGAIGVSGVKADQDGQIARVGVAALQGAATD